MSTKKLFFWLIIFLLLGCKYKSQIYKINGQNIAIGNDSKIDKNIENFIAPYKKELDSTEKSMHQKLSFSPKALNKKEGYLNTAIGNMMADAVFEICKPLLLKQTNKQLDMVMLNHGGIRAELPKGDITAKTAFSIMPFENSVVVVELSGEVIKNELLSYLIEEQTAHPISGLSIELNKDNSIKHALINGKKIDSEITYFVGTSDYLLNGGDRMTFFAKNKSIYNLNYKIRSLLIDYFRMKDTLNPSPDNRFIKTKL